MKIGGMETLVQEKDEEFKEPDRVLKREVAFDQGDGGGPCDTRFPQTGVIGNTCLHVCKLRITATET